MAALDDFSAILVGALSPILFGHEGLVLGRETMWAVLGACMRRLQSFAPGARLVTASGAAQKLIVTVVVVDGEKGAASRVEAPGWSTPPGTTPVEPGCQHQDVPPRC